MYEEHDYKVCVNTGTYSSCVVKVKAYNIQDAIDMVIDKLEEEESPLVFDYYAIADECEAGETVDEYAEANNLICGGNHGLYISIDAVYEDGEFVG